MICPLCGTEFDESDRACAGSCPIAGVQGCNLVCCPHCGYQMVDENRSALARGLRKLLGGRTEGTGRARPQRGDTGRGAAGRGEGRREGAGRGREQQRGGTERGESSGRGDAGARPQPPAAGESGGRP